MAVGVPESTRVPASKASPAGSPPPPDWARECVIVPLPPLACGSVTLAMAMWRG